MTSSIADQDVSKRGKSVLVGAADSKVLYGLRRLVLEVLYQVNCRVALLEELHCDVLNPFWNCG